MCPALNVAARAAASVRERAGLRSLAVEWFIRVCTGCAGSIINLLSMKEFNHQVNVIKGIKEEECSKMMKDFFANLRKNKKKEVKQGIKKED